MTDNKTEPNYQDILDKYADSIKSTELPPTPKPEPDPKSTPKPEPLLDAPLTPESKLKINSQEEVKSVSDSPIEPEIQTMPAAETETETIPQPEIQIPEESVPESIEPKSKPQLEPQPLNLTTPPAPEAVTNPNPPEEIAPESSEIIPPKENHFFKYLFFFSLFIFIAVLISIIFSFINSQKSLSDTKNIPTIISPTVAPNNVCKINSQTYAVGEVFPATDGCNTCSCSEDLQITCTTKACDATNSATSSVNTLRSQVEDWKTYTQNSSKLSWDKCGEVETETSINIKDTISNEIAYTKEIDNYKIFYTQKLNFTVDDLKKFEICATGDLTPIQIIGDKILWADGCGGILDEAALSCNKTLKEIEIIYKL